MTLQNRMACMVLSDFTLVETEMHKVSFCGVSHKLICDGATLQSGSGVAPPRRDASLPEHDARPVTAILLSEVLTYDFLTCIFHKSQYFHELLTWYYTKSENVFSTIFFKSIVVWYGMECQGIIWYGMA